MLQRLRTDIHCTLTKYLAGEEDQQRIEFFSRYLLVRPELGESYDPLAREIARNPGSFELLLEDPAVQVRKAAIELLGRLDMVELAENIGAIAVGLQDQEAGVCREARRMLASLEQHGDASMKLSERNTLLHRAAEHGLLNLAQCLVAKHGTVLLNARNDSGDTPLHLAAQHGHLAVCQELIRTGGLIRVMNNFKQTPEAMARRNRHVDTAAWLSSKMNISAVRGGAGDALSNVIRDRRPILKVEWYIMQMPGFNGAMGITHSLLSITVGNLDDWHAYVLEKAFSPQSSTEQYKNGVFASHWEDVAPSIDSYPIYTLHGVDIERAHRDLSMRVLRNIAVDLGPYDVASCNCHHAALAVYNACAKQPYRISSIPNQYYVNIAWLLQKLGVDVSRSESCASVPSQSVGDMHSNSNPSVSKANPNSNAISNLATSHYFQRCV